MEPDTFRRKSKPAHGWGRLLYDARADLRITQAEMAAKLKVHVNTYGNYENGSKYPPFKIVERALNLAGRELRVGKARARARD